MQTYVVVCAAEHVQIIMFSDLECDYINPIDLCNKLNQVSVFLIALCSPICYSSA